MTEPKCGEWIAIKDRLPKYGDDVLFFTIYEEMGVSSLENLAFLSEDPLRIEWGEAGLLKLNNFTHWMLLPPAPKLVKTSEQTDKDISCFAKCNGDIKP